MGVQGFDRKVKIWIISACVELVYIKTSKKINAENNFVAADAAIAA